MGGLLTHLSVSIIGFLVGTFIFNNWKYGIAFFIGQLTPDLIDFGTIGLFTGSTNPQEIMLSPWFLPLMRLGHTFWHWIVFGLVVFIILFVLNKMKKIKYKVWLIVLLFLIAGVGTHIAIDHIIIENSYWI